MCPPGYVDDGDYCCGYAANKVRSKYYREWIARLPIECSVEVKVMKRKQRTKRSKAFA